MPKPTAPTGPRSRPLYDRLLHVAPSPVVQLNRAVAIAAAVGLDTGLALVDQLSATLDRSHLLHATRADLLRRLGSTTEAAGAYRRALELAPTGPERRFLERRLAAL